jgi:hypothetical protein
VVRAIGRGFGIGTFGLAQAPKGNATPTASARLVASAVDRKAVAREGITVFLCGGESFNRSSPYVYLTEYVDKMLKRRGRACLRHHRGEIAAIAVGEDGPAGAGKQR